jgi:hypothetical protein
LEGGSTDYPNVEFTLSADGVEKAQLLPGIEWIALRGAWGKESGSLPSNERRPRLAEQW